MTQRRTASATNRVSLLICAATLGALVVPSRSHAFDPDVHRILTVRSLRGQIQHGTVLPPDMAALIDFYSWLGWSLAQRGGDEAGKQRFRKLFPARNDFDAIGVRRLLGLSHDPSIEIWGITEVTKEPEPDRFSTAADASARPITDRRDRNRVRFSLQRTQIKGPWGLPVPLDPRTLNLGPAVGEGSETWARTALPSALTSTSAPASSGLRVVPYVAGVAVRGGAAEMAQVHMDLSVLALYWGDSQYKQTAEYLSLVWLGAALHYVQEAASPLHNVQLGSPKLLEAMAARHRTAALKTGGGLWGPLPNPVIAGLRMRRNLRIVGDRWLAAQVAAALDDAAAPKSVVTALAELRKTGSPFEMAVRPGLQPWLQPPSKAEPSAKGRGAVSVLVDSLAAAGAADGAALYDALAAVTKPRWRSGDQALQEMGGLAAPPWGEGTAAAWATIEDIQTRALRRGGTATILAFDAWLNANPHAALDRLRRVRTVALEREAVDMAAWVTRVENPAGLRDPRWAYGEGAAGLLVVVLGGLWIRRRRRR